jgi:hypothetical protein
MPIYLQPPKYNISDEQKNAIFKSTVDYIEKAIENGSSKPLIRTLCMLCANDQFRLMVIVFVHRVFYINVVLL